MPHSQLKEHVAKVLKAEGYIDDVRVNERGGRRNQRHKTLLLVMRYGRDRTSAIDGIRRVSSPGAASTSVTTASRASARAWACRSFPRARA